MWTGLGFGAGRAWEECDSVCSAGNILQAWESSMLTIPSELQARVGANTRRIAYAAPLDDGNLLETLHA